MYSSRLCCNIGQATNSISRSLTTVSLSRLLLNLRGLACASDVLSAEGPTSPGSHSSTLDFSQFVGTLGNVVDDGISGLDEEDMKTDDAVYAGNTTPATDIELEPVRRTLQSVSWFMGHTDSDNHEYASEELQTDIPTILRRFRSRCWCESLRPYSHRSGA